ncbi:MAG: SAM-dependent methyltransferase [Chloroflexota bacterium]
MLDPFSGTGTTGLVCAEKGIACDLVELNPFLVWLAKVKLHQYTEKELLLAYELARAASVQASHLKQADKLWIPPLNFIERWWSEDRLMTLAKLFHGLEVNHSHELTSPPLNLALIAFCRVAMKWSNATFNHQSVSFKGIPSEPFKIIEEVQPRLFDVDGSRDLITDFLSSVEEVIAAVNHSIKSRTVVYEGDARNIQTITLHKYDCVITSPPYPNRISYIRELRPYMYWLKFLKEAREAGELDWSAIGGTWGIATSRLNQWEYNGKAVPYEGFDTMIAQISKSSALLANYVHKYFVDISSHLSNLKPSLASGAKLFYIVGNSKFYGTLVPVEEIYAGIMREQGFNQVRVEPLRKRNSKKELYEFVVSAEKS